MSIISKLKNAFTNNENKTIAINTEIHIHINDKLKPLERGEIYEEPLENYISENEFGEIVNSGTMQEKNGEILFCDIDIQITNSKTDRKKLISDIINILELAEIPQGSYILDKQTNEKISIGKLQGIGIYLNGTDLPDEVYKNSDINVVVSELQKLLGIEKQNLRFWQGPTETALYFFIPNFNNAKENIENFLKSYPLCQKCRIEKIA